MIPPRPTDDRLYRLLPAIYRIRDMAQGEPLRALLAIIQQELQVVEADIDALYDNWFIETCDNWVVPYIGDLLDVAELDTGNPVVGDVATERDGFYGHQERRAYVANTLAYRRRKGTMPVLEQLTQDVTGWRSRAVEFGRLVSTTQNLERIRPASRTVDLRANDRLQQIGTPFETQAAYSVEVRPVSQGGRYNVSNIGLYVWRLQSYPLERVQAREIGACRYTFNSVGSEQVPLFNQPQTKTNITTLASEINVPAILRRPVLADELSRRRQIRSQGLPLLSDIRYFDTDPVLQIFINGQPQSLPPETILITDLATPAVEEDATLDNQSETMTWPMADQIPWDSSDALLPTLPPAYLVAVDPERGRLLLRPGFCPARVDVSYFYGFSGDVGGGSYSRIATLPAELKPVQLPISPWHWQVRQADSADPNPLASAIEDWNRTVVVRYGLRSHTHIPLALITIPPIQVAKVRESEDEMLPEFKPGWVRGLEVTRGLCRNELIVRPGLAVDDQGRPLALSRSWCFDVSARFATEISQLRDRTGILVLYYKPTEQGNPVDLDLVAETLIEGYPTGTVFPLAQLCFDESNQLQRLSPPEISIPQLQPGILQGLEVYTRPGALETLIRPGIAVDDQGNGLTLVDPYPIALKDYQGSEPQLILVPSAPAEQRIRLVSEAELTALQLPYIRLARLSVPRVALGQIETHPERIGRALDIRKTDLTVTPVGATIQVAAGSLALPSGQTFSLKAAQHIDLSAYAGRTLLLFLSDRPDQGFPLDFTLTSDTEADTYLGIIPVEPLSEGDTTDPLKLEEVDVGWIAIQDSGTYPGDFAIAVPPHSRLQIVASDGDRPHVQGNLSIQGWYAAQQAQAELMLNGLLIDGYLEVLPGSLGRLSLHHCTVVPQAGGLCVYGQTEPEPNCEDSNFSLLAFVTYCLVALWRLIGQDLGISSNAPSMTITQFLQTSWHQLVAGLMETLVSSRQTNTIAWGDIPLENVENDRLVIDLYRTITGALYLTDTVPTLRIEDSVVDKGHSDQSSAVAIAASGTAIEMRTTTVLGRTTARQLEASDCLFTEKVTVLRHQEGCIRFSYVPVASSTPRRYRCQPDLALQDALDSIASGVTALASIAASEELTTANGSESSADNSYSVLVGTDKDGVFTLHQPVTQGAATIDTNSSSATESTSIEWQDANGDLPDRNLTAIAAYRWPQTSMTETKLEVLAGTATGDIFYLDDQTATHLLGETLASAPEPDWRLLPLPSINAAITSLYPDQVNGTGTLRIRASAVLSDGTTSAQVIGQATRFSTELQVDDIMMIETDLWRVEQIGRPSRNSTVTLSGRTAKIDGETPDGLSVGDTITITQLLRQGTRQQTIAQTRRITALNSGTAVTTIILNTPFGSEIEQETPLSFLLNIDTELAVKSVAAQPQTPEARPEDAGPETTESDASEPGSSEPGSLASNNFTFQILRLWATTDGSGIWRGAIAGQSWQPLNAGLTNLSVTTIVRDQDQHFWIGTRGSGIFRLTSTSTGNAGDQWMAVNQGLSTGTITDLIRLDNNQLLAATNAGIFSWNRDRENWEASSEGLTSGDITVLAIGRQKTESANRQGIHVFAGSGDGKVFHSDDGGRTWQPLGLDLRGTDITALIVEPSSGDIWLGSAAGEVLRSHDNGQNWQSIQNGRSALATKLQILNQIQPSFTSTRYGDPGYMQLRETTPTAIRTGAENGAEMGVFNYLKQPQRAANLTTSLNEYLRFGLAAGIFYMT